MLLADTHHPICKLTICSHPSQAKWVLLMAARYGVTPFKAPYSDVKKKLGLRLRELASTTDARDHTRSHNLGLVISTISVSTTSSGGMLVRNLK